MMLPIITHDRIELAPGDELILRFRTWQDYEDLLARRQDRAGLRIRYSQATQEIKIMSPLPGHSKNADLLADLVKALLKHQGKDWEAFTPITLKREEELGVEPDYCFYIQNRDRILGHERINLQTDPPPDLVIEIDLTSMTQAETYQAIAAPELWIYRRDQLLIYQFENGRYQDSQTSPQFPNFDIKTLVKQYVDRGWQAGSSVAVREFEVFLSECSNPI